jgi:hypothetical protein
MDTISGRFDAFLQQKKRANVMQLFLRRNKNLRGHNAERILQG